MEQQPKVVTPEERAQHGGLYIVDKNTGATTLVERTQPPAPPAVPEAGDAGASEE